MLLASHVKIMIQSDDLAIFAAKNILNEKTNQNEENVNYSLVFRKVQYCLALFMKYDMRNINKTTLFGILHAFSVLQRMIKKAVL